jgi:hypothetical protein
MMFLDSNRNGAPGGDGAMRQSDPAPEPTSQANDGQEDFEPEDSLPF